ncbi:ABC transporter substrate-binding protein, partial [Streptomyces sp. SID2563]|uniref:ABC transporter substrate-binding protein n=1 Tax=Streptomyces sp. SID2563 TaxID=2690255 RepID=UPI0013686172
AGAVVLAGGGTAAWLAATRRGGTGKAPGPLPAYRVALHADLTGPGKAVGLAHRSGALLAIDAHNSRTDKTFTLALRTEDDAGDPARALDVADRITADARVLAVIGPTSEVVDDKVAVRYEKARLAQVVVAAGATTAAGAGPASLCVLRPSDPALAIGLISYLARVRPTDHVVIIEDRADARSSWAIREDLPKAPVNGVGYTTETVAATARTFAPAARAAVAAGAGAVIYAGSSAARGARCAKDLAAAGFTGTGMSVGPVLAPAFLRDAGPAGEGWVFAEAYTDPAALPAAKAFTAAHRERFGAPPATWAAETYDAVGLIARAARTTSAVDAPRDGVAGRILSTTYQGITRSLSFYDSHQVRPESGIFLHRVDGGRARFLGLHTSV